MRCPNCIGIMEDKGAQGIKHCPECGATFFILCTTKPNKRIQDMNPTGLQQLIIKELQAWGIGSGKSTLIRMLAFLDKKGVL